MHVRVRKDTNEYRTSWLGSHKLNQQAYHQNQGDFDLSIQRDHHMIIIIIRVAATAAINLNMNVC